MTLRNQTGWTAMFIAVLGLMTTGCGAASHSTPEAAFEAGKEAMKKEDFKTFCDNLTPDSRDSMAAMMVVAGSFMSAFAELPGGDKDAEKMKEAAGKMKEVFKKHGLDEAKFKDLLAAGPPKGSDKEATKKLIEPIKDRSAFVGEMFAIMKTTGKDDMDKMPFKPDAKLVDLKTEGDSATAVIAWTNKEGKEQRDPIAFKKVEGGWKIDIPELTKL